MSQEEKKDWLFAIFGILLVVYISYRYAIPADYLNLYYLGAAIFGILFLVRFFYKRKKKKRAWPYLIFPIVIIIWWGYHLSRPDIWYLK